MTQPSRPPLSGGNLEAVCSIDEDILRDIRDLGEDDEEYVTDMIFRPGYGGTAQLCRQSDAQAAIAALVAEARRFREALDQIYSLPAPAKQDRIGRAAQYIATKALKGSEA